MKKFLGVVRVTLEEHFMRSEQQIVCHFADTRQEMEQWFSSYPKAPYVI